MIIEAKERLKTIRNHTGLSQQKLANVLDIKVTVINHIENGTQKSFSYDLAYKLNQKYGYNIHWMMTGEGRIKDTSLLRIDNTTIVKKLDSFYKRFNQLQKENDLNDYQFSKETGISEARIEKLGIGKVLPTLEELNALKTHFDVSIDWLLYGETPCRNAQSENNTLSAQEITILKQMAQKFNV